MQEFIPEVADKGFTGNVLANLIFQVVVQPGRAAS